MILLHTLTPGGNKLNKLNPTHALDLHTCLAHLKAESMTFSTVFCTLYKSVTGAQKIF